jgi:threonine dehydratase
MVPDLKAIEQAAKRIHHYIHRTPVLTSKNINALLGAEVFFKCENFQKAGAFKFRGATNGVFSLTDEEVKNGVCTHSSGNHAQALALAAHNRGIKAYIVMPETSSRVKVDAVQNYGGIITFCKPTLASREETLKVVMTRTNATELHPYNDYRTIAGQATAAKELIEDVPHLDYILTPVGGGGLLSGTALITKYISPTTLVVGSEPDQANDAYRSFTTRKLVPSINPKTIADGLLTSLGSLTFPIILDYVHKILTVREDSIIDAMKLIWERMKIIIEPSSAVPVAALLEISKSVDIRALEIKGKKIGIILSGGNVDLMKIPWMR